MDYINLKFKIALTKNKINIKQDQFVSENDILEIYNKLKNCKQLKVKQELRSPAKATKENKNLFSKNSGVKVNGKMGYSEFALGLENFIEVISDKCNKTISQTVNEKFIEAESDIFECINKSMKDISKKLQKSIDNLVQDNIFKLKLISKRVNSAESLNNIRSGKKKSKSKSKKKPAQRTSTSVNQIEFQPQRSTSGHKSFENAFVSQNSQDRYSKAYVKEPKDDSIFDSANLVDSRENPNTFHKTGVLKPSLKQNINEFGENNAMFGLQPYNQKNKLNMSNNQYNFAELYNLNKFQTTSPSEINNRDSESKITSKGPFVSFRKECNEGHIPIGEELKMNDLNQDVFDMSDPNPTSYPKSSSNFNSKSDCLTSMNLSSSLMKIKHQISDEMGESELIAMKDKIKNMLEFYEA